MVQKGDAVWYYVEKASTWKRGKVANVNRHCLHVKDGRKTIEVPARLPVEDGALPKPNHEPYGYSHPLWPYTWGYYGTKEAREKGRLLKKLNLL